VIRATPTSKLYSDSDYPSINLTLMENGCQTFSSLQRSITRPPLAPKPSRE
jgi:hypothetical protein